MKVSVVIPCHNAQATIAQTLQSVAAQNVAPHEIIVVDDRSTDASVAAARASGVEFRLVSADRGNAGAARNAGIARASGDWVALLDADDAWFPQHLSAAADWLEAGDDVAWMANHCFRRDGIDEPLPDAMRHPLTRSRGGIAGADWVEMQLRGFHFGHSTVIYRRARLNEVGGFDESFARQEDLDLWLRVVSERTWAYGADVAAAYRVDSPGSLTKNLALCELCYLRVWRKNRASFPLEATDKLMESSARRAMSLAFVDGTRADFYAAWRLARAQLSGPWRVFYALAPLARPLLQTAIRLKRRWVWRRI